MYWLKQFRLIKEIDDTKYLLYDDLLWLDDGYKIHYNKILSKYNHDIEMIKNNNGTISNVIIKYNNKTIDCSLRNKYDKKYNKNPIRIYDVTYKNGDYALFDYEKLDEHDDYIEHVIHKNDIKTIWKHTEKMKLKEITKEKNDKIIFHYIAAKNAIFCNISNYETQISYRIKLKEPFKPTYCKLFPVDIKYEKIINNMFHKLNTKIEKPINVNITINDICYTDDSDLFDFNNCDIAHIKRIRWCFYAIYEMVYCEGINSDILNYIIKNLLKIIKKHNKIPYFVKLFSFAHIRNILKDSFYHNNRREYDTLNEALKKIYKNI